MIENERPLVVRRTVPAPRARIFEAFSRPDLLSQWFTPSADISIEILMFDFVPGGRFRLRYVMPDGRRPAVGGEYERIEPPALIILSWIWEPPDPLENVPMRVIFQFDDALDDSGAATEVVIRHEKLPSDAACTIHADGWEGSLNSLERFLGLTNAETE
ncbi:MAG: SRPBCC domain-containing protein [Pseudomonadota bacterium]